MRIHGNSVLCIYLAVFLSRDLSKITGHLWNVKKILKDMLYLPCLHHVPHLPIWPRGRATQQEEYEFIAELGLNLWSVTSGKWLNLNLGCLRFQCLNHAGFLWGLNGTSHYSSLTESTENLNKYYFDNYLLFSFPHSPQTLEFGLYYLTCQDSYVYTFLISSVFHFTNQHQIHCPKIQFSYSCHFPQHLKYIMDSCCL